MDSSFLRASQSEYSEQRTGMKFTVRSANSPTYSLSRKSCVRKQQSTEEVAERQRYGTHTGTNVTNKDGDTISGYESRTRSGSSLRTNKTIPDFGTERRENPALESQGRSEWRASNLTSRSKSLDLRTGARSPDHCARADFSQLSKKSGGDIGKQAGVLEGRRTRIEGGVQDRISSLQAWNSAGASNVRDRSQALENGIKGNTLPSRFRTLSASSCKCTETTFSVGSKAGQSILERIEKLYGFGQVDDNKRRNSCNNHETSGDSLISPRQKLPEKTARGTLPLGFFSGETYSPVKSGKPFICTQKDTNSSGHATSFSPGRSMSRESSPGWQTQGRYAEEGGDNWGKGFVGTGTKSLDRARSRSSVAAQIRAARANQQPNVFSEETSDFLRDSSGFRVRKTNADDGANQMSELTNCEDVFEMNPQKTKRKTAASVRNKISQFEALTQRAQGLAPGPRRTFSVPTPVSTGHEGVKKSGSVTEIRELRKKWEGVKEGEEARGKAEDNVMGTGKKVPSLDEVGLRIEKTGLNSLNQKGKNNCSENFDKYSRLRTTPEMPQRGGAVNGKLGTHETDFLKAPSPEETANSTAAPLQPCGPFQWERTRSEITSPVSDDEHTPTNSPSHLLIASPMAQQGDDTPTAESEKRSTPVVTHQTKTHDPDSRPRALAASSHSSLQDHISPDVKTATPKGKKRIMDLNAWIAGLNPNLKVFSDDEDMDDDESTQKDEDSNYDSDSGGSSVTITSNMSQSDHRSFSLSLSDLCNFAGADYDSEIDSDDWQSADRRSASLSSDMSSFSCVSVLPTEELDKLVEEVRNLGDDALQDYNDVQVVVLHKEVGTGLGFSLAGGVDQNKPITVHKVFHTGVAAKQGSIKEGDQVLSINGTALSGSAHWEALRVLRRAKARDMVVVVLRRGGITDSPKKGEEGNNQGQTQEQYETGHLVCVQLQKNSRDLGFSLEGGEGSSLGNRPLTVQKIFQGGPVDTVCPGDELLEIQGTSVVGMRRLEAWTLIRGLPPGPVEVLLRRCL